MRTILILFSLMTALLMAPRPAAADPVTAKERAAQLTMDTGTYDAYGELLVIEVQGLQCDVCGRIIERAFLELKETAGVKVDLNEQTVMVSLKDGFTLEDSVIEGIITNAGYTIWDLQRKAGL